VDAREEGDYAAVERDYRKAIALGNKDCLPCFGEVLLLQKNTRTPSRRQAALPLPRYRR
jgi:hypothetical protein